MSHTPLYRMESLKKAQEARRGKPSWNAGTSQGWKDKRGYRWVYITENGKRRAIREHRLVMERHLGKKLSPEEVVHHRNGQRDDNAINNLEVTTWDAHTMGHHKGSVRTDSQKRSLEVLANYREEAKRLKALNSTLLEALETLKHFCIDRMNTTNCPLGRGAQLLHRYPLGFTIHLL